MKIPMTLLRVEHNLSVFNSVSVKSVKIPMTLLRVEHSCAQAARQRASGEDSDDSIKS